ncbi:hypothetical protein DFQ50_102363 [Pseudocitrobacter faecalis]|uniref:Uncharacterized protein n=1 Tax=Pseudocitrobacter faecalis TaxID=1398493 RepID=A0ABX9G4X0_9ENTR|nr:hypothetical protein DFQ50_102363 [Pseudocitrobacter faecalis]
MLIAQVAGMYLYEMMQTGDACIKKINSHREYER